MVSDSRTSPVFSTGSAEPEREAGPAAIRYVKSEKSDTDSLIERLRCDACVSSARAAWTDDSADPIARRDELGI